MPIVRRRIHRCFHLLRFAVWASLFSIPCSALAQGAPTRITMKAPLREVTILASTAQTTGALERAAWVQAVSAHEEPGPVLRVQFPIDGRVFYSDRARYAGCTEPGAQVSVNDEAVRVYPNGAFAGVVSLEPGPNPVKVVAVRGGAATVETVEVRRVVLEPLPRHPVAVASDRPILPADLQALQPGDTLTVQCEASPGARVWFCIGARKQRYPMTELSVARNEASRAGFYRGVYVVQAGDAFVQAPIRVFIGDGGQPTPPPDKARLKGGKGSRRVLSASARGLLTTTRRYTERVARVTNDDTGLYTDSDASIRLTSINEGTRLRITAQRGDMLRAAMGDGALWVMRKNVRLLHPGAEAPAPPFIPFPDVERAGGGAGDLIFSFPSLTLSGSSYSHALPYRAEAADGGTTLALTLWNATGKPGSVDLDEPAPDKPTGHERRMRRRMADTGLVRAVTCAMPDTRTVRYTFRLARSPVWGFDVEFDSGRCRLRIEAPPRWKPEGNLGGVHVFLDAGHGGHDTGAIGPAGLCESHVNLAIADRLEALLKKGGAKVSRTRREDRYVSLEDRVARIGESGADLMVSIHNNSIAETSDPMLSRGPVMFYYHPHARALAAALFSEMPNPGPAIPVARGVRYRSLKLPRAGRRMPGVLLEGLFLSHPEDEMLLLDSDFLDTLSRALYKGIVSYVESARPRQDVGKQP